MTIAPQLQQILSRKPVLRITDLGPQGMRDAFLQARAAMPLPQLPKVENRLIADRIGVRIHRPEQDPKDLPAGRRNCCHREAAR